MKESKKYCVYVHCKKTTNQVFYVGKGSIKRANTKSYSSRNEYWGRVAKKHGFYSVILFMDLTNDQACKIEKDLIAEFGRENLCNLTDGGDGTPGRIVTDEIKKLMSDKFKGISPSQNTIKASIDKNSKPIGTKCGLRFKSTSDAARWLRTRGNPTANKSGIFTALEGRANKAYGYEFRYVNDSGEIIESSYVDKTKSNYKAVTNGDRVFSSIMEASNYVLENGLSSAKSINTVSANIVSCCKKRGRLKTVYGFSWSYTND